MTHWRCSTHAIACGATLTAFECFNDFCLTLVERHYAGQHSPFSERHPHYVLLELSDHESQDHATAMAEDLIASAIETGWVRTAVVAQSLAQARSLWSLRELISEAQTQEGKNIKHDIAVPISSIARFVEESDVLLQQRFPGVRMVVFGHLGDGNLHYNVSPPVGRTKRASWNSNRRSTPRCTTRPMPLADRSRPSTASAS